jgi:hypothetical protein
MAKAPKGKPPAMPLAMVRKAIFNPRFEVANRGPVRQKPVWTSSMMRRVPLAVHRSDRVPEVPLGRNDDPAFALDGFQDHRRHAPPPVQKPPGSRRPCRR